MVNVLSFVLKNVAGLLLFTYQICCLILLLAAVAVAGLQPAVQEADATMLP